MRDAKEAQTLFTQILGTLQNASPNDLSPTLRGFLQMCSTELMAKYRMLNAIYCASLRPPALYGETRQTEAVQSGRKSGEARRNEERNKAIRAEATRLQRVHPGWKSHSIIHELQKSYKLSPRQLQRILHLQ